MLAALAIDIGGATASSVFQDAANSGKFDLLAITGSAALGGALNVNLINGIGGNPFVPANNQTFKILTTAANGISGAFTNTGASSNGAGVRVALANGLSSFLVNYDPADVTLSGYLSDNQWQGASGSSWSPTSSWTAFVPSAEGQIAKFADASASMGAVAVNLDASQTIGGMIFNSSVRQYTISGPGTLALNNNGVASAITVSGAHTVSVPAVFG